MLRTVMDAGLEPESKWVQVKPKGVPDDDVYGRYNKMKAKPELVSINSSGMSELISINIIWVRAES